jgi:hypothetical protein
MFKSNLRSLLLVGLCAIITSGANSKAADVELSDLVERFDCLVPMNPGSQALTRVRVYTSPNLPIIDLSQEIANSVVADVDTNARATHEQELGQIANSQEEIHKKEIQARISDLKEAISKGFGHYAAQAILNLKFKSESGFVAIGDQIPTLETLIAADSFVTSENNWYTTLGFRKSVEGQVTNIATVRVGQTPFAKIEAKTEFGQGTVFEGNLPSTCKFH